MNTREANPIHKDWDQSVDVVVAGAGAAGMAAALFSSQRGLETLVLEKSSQVGGTSATSAGSLWIPGNAAGRRAGYRDNPQDVLRYLRALVGPHADSPQVAAFLENGPGVIEELEAASGLRFVSAGFHPDYRDLPGAATAGRVIVPEPFDGRRLGAEFRRVRPPIRELMVLGGMMVGKPDVQRLLGRFRSLSNFAYAGRLAARYYTDRLRYPRGTRLVMGNAMVGELYYTLRQRKVPVLFDHAIVQLVTEGGVVRGVEVSAATGTQRIQARRGVILATGGFGHRRELREEFMPHPTPQRSLACETDTGDGILAGRAAGALLQASAHREGGLWTPMSETVWPDGSRGLYPHIILDRAKPGLIAVNAAGRRFVNEANSYHDFVSGMLRSHRTVPTEPAWLICTAAFVRRYGLGLIYPGTTSLAKHEREGHFAVADSLTRLADRIGVDAKGLEESVRRHNDCARTGVDLDFGKGSTQVNRANGDADVKPNPCLAPIDQGPYCAMAVWAAEIATSTGLETDEHARVLHAATGEPLPGLYACGNDMGSIFRGTYPGPGATLGPAVVFGWLAARHIAGDRTSRPAASHHRGVPESVFSQHR